MRESCQMYPCVKVINNVTIPSFPGNILQPIITINDKYFLFVISVALFDSVDGMNKRTFSDIQMWQQDYSGSY